MAAYTADYKNVLPTNGQVTVTMLNAMNTNEVNKGTAANNAYAAGWTEGTTFAAYTTTGGGSGIQNYMSKTYGNNP